MKHYHFVAIPLFIFGDISKTQGYRHWVWHSANEKESEGFLYMIFFNLLVVHSVLHILIKSCSGVWRQADGTLMSWSPWWLARKDAQGNPSGGKAENCAGVHLDDRTFAGQWADDTCTNAHYYVCERGL